jgi:hypothetical protein
MKNNKISYYQLGAYGKVEMPMSERFSLERSALDDDFLFESLEGYTHNEAIPQEHLLARFDDLVEEKRKTAVVRKLAPYRWIAGVAASIIIFSAVAYFYNGNNGITHNENQIVENNVGAPVEESAQDLVGIGDNMENLTSDNIPDKRVVAQKSKEDVRRIPEKETKIAQEKSEPKSPQIALNLESSSGNQALTKDEGVPVQSATEKVARVGEKIEKPLSKKADIIRSKKAYRPSTTMEFATESVEGVEDFLLDIPTEKQISDWIDQGLQEAGFDEDSNNASIMVLQFTSERVLEICIFQEGDEGLVKKINELLVGKKLSGLNDKMLQKRLIFRYKSK